MQVINTVINGADPTVPSYSNINPVNFQSFQRDIGSIQVGPSPFSAGDSDIYRPTFNRRTRRTNAVAQRQYSVVPWEDQSQIYISPGALVFNVNYSLEETKGATCMATVATVNQAIQLNTQIHQNEMIKDDPDPEHAEFARLLRIYGEKGLEEYVNAVLHNKLERLTGEEKGDLKELHRLAMTADLRYLTKVGIVQHLNFLGVVRNVEPSTDTYNGMDRERFETFTDVNVMLQGKGEVGNFWGGLRHQKLPAGSKLYLVLKKNDKTGIYEIFPYSTRESYLPGYLRRNTFTWFVGTVLYDDQDIPSYEQTQKSIRNHDPIVAYHNVELLPRITIMIRK